MGGRRREKEGEGRGAGGIVGGKEEGEREGEEGHGGRSEDLGSVQVQGRAVVFGWHALPSCAVPLRQCASVPVCQCASVRERQAASLVYTIAYSPCAPRLLTLWARAGRGAQGE